MLGVAKAWTLDPGAHTCGAFLYQLLDCVACVPPGQQGYVWREYANIAFAGFQLGAFSAWAAPHTGPNGTVMVGAPVSLRRLPGSAGLSRAATPTIYQLPRAPRALPSSPREVARHARMQARANVGHNLWLRSIAIPGAQLVENLTVDPLNFEEALEEIKNRRYEATERALQQLRRVVCAGAPKAARNASEILMQMQDLVRRHLFDLIQYSYDAAKDELFDEAIESIRVVEEALAQLPSMDFDDARTAKEEARTFRAEQMDAAAHMGYRRRKLQQARKQGQSRLANTEWVSEWESHHAVEAEMIEAQMAALTKVIEADTHGIQVIEGGRHQDVTHKAAMMEKIERLREGREAEMQSLKERLITVRANAGLAAQRLRDMHKDAHRDLLRAATGLGEASTRAMSWATTR